MHFICRHIYQKKRKDSYFLYTYAFLIPFFLLRLQIFGQQIDKNQQSILIEIFAIIIQIKKNFQRQLKRKTMTKNFTQKSVISNITFLASFWAYALPAFFQRSCRGPVFSSTVPFQSQIRPPAF